MKKIILVAVAALMLGFSANAQLYVGGSAGCSVQHSNFSGFFAPEVGYSFNDHFAAGGFLSLGGAKGEFSWSINPYVRWTFLNIEGFGMFAEGTFGIGTVKFDGADASTTDWNISLVPGLSYRVGEHFSFLARICSLGYERFGDSGAFAFQLNMTPTIGIAYNF